MLDKMGDDYFDNICGDARYGDIQDEVKRIAGEWVRVWENNLYKNL